jgi:hypothetical protein
VAKKSCIYSGIKPCHSLMNNRGNMRLVELNADSE